MSLANVCLVWWVIREDLKDDKMGEEGGDVCVMFPEVMLMLRMRVGLGGEYFSFFAVVLSSLPVCWISVPRVSSHLHRSLRCIHRAVIVNRFDDQS